MREQQILLQKQRNISSNQEANYGEPDFHALQYINEIASVGWWLITDTPLDLDGILIGLSVSINATTGGLLFVKINDEWIEASPVYSLQIAKSGHKKSLVESKLRNPFVDYEKKITVSMPRLSSKIIKAIHQKSIKESVENIDFSSPASILSAIESANRNEKIIKQATESSGRRLLLSSFTDYGLMEFLEENSEAALFLDSEGSELVKFLLHQPLELYLKSYGQEMVIKTTARKRTRLERAALYMLVFGQPDIALKIYGNRLLNGRGVNQRILPFIHNGNTSFRFFGDPEEMQKIYNDKIHLCINTFVEMAKEKKVYFVYLSQDALNYFETFRAWCTSQVCDIEFYPEWLEKLPGQACRLALAAHIWRDPKNAVSTHITLEEIKHGCQLAAACVQSSQYLFSPLGLQAQMDAKRIVASLQRIGTPDEREAFIRNGTTSSEIQQRTGLHRQEVNNALYHLEKCGFVAILDMGYGNLQVTGSHNFFSMYFE